MSSQNILSLDTELRKLRPAELYTLGEILNVADSWKQLMAIIPRDGTPDVPKFNSEHFSLIEQAVQQQKRSAAEIFLQEWATMGRSRPTLGLLLDFLVKSELFRAADYIAVDLLKGATPRRPQHGPAAVVDISEETIQKLIQNKLEDADNTDECVIFGSSAELIMVKEVYLPETTVNAAPNSYLRCNMRSTKLAAEADYQCIKNSFGENKESDRGATEISDLLKFDSLERNVVNPPEHRDNNIGTLKSTDHECKPVASFICNKQEMSSNELPIILNDFAEYKNANLLNVNEELQSQDLPLFLNNSVSLEEPRQVLQTKNTLYSNSNIIPKEMSSDSLPQILNRLPSTALTITNKISNNKTENGINVQNVIGSQELPITVLEYQRD